MHNSKYSIPHNWMNCPRKSSLIADTFIVCKTILDKNYDAEIPEENRFNWKMLNGSVQSNINRTIGMVIDLTNTDRFYDIKEIVRDGCRHVKIACKGFEESPNQKTVNEFIHSVLGFTNDNPQKIICVHCTHGFNRSGFMIVSYLFNVMNIDLQTSINMFANARYPGIYKEEYLNELSIRYGNGTQTFVKPQLPNWHKGDKQFAGRHRTNYIKLKKTKFMDGMIPNVDNVTDIKLVKKIQSIVTKICGWSDCRFPGSQPVGMNAENIKMLTAKNYKVTWKADGQRYLMLIKGNNEIFMLDRDLAVYRVNNMTFPRRKVPNEHITDTLLDGEMVIDRYPQSMMGRYLVYDIIRFEGQEVSKTNFDVRLKCISLEIDQPRKFQMEKGLLNKSKEPFEVYPKPFWDPKQSRKLLDGSFSKKLLHETDGLIFQPLDDVYKFGQCNEVLKWKPPELNTVDFKLIIDSSQVDSSVGYLMVGGFQPSFATIEVTPQLSQYNNKIIECSWDFGEKVWKFMRERTDKSYPNKISTVQSIMRSIKNPITKELLYNVIETQKFEFIPSSNSSTGNQSNASLSTDHSSVATSGCCKRLTDSDPFGLCSEVESLIQSFNSPNEMRVLAEGDYYIPIFAGLLDPQDPLGLQDVL